MGRQRRQPRGDHRRRNRPRAAEIDEGHRDGDLLQALSVIGLGATRVDQDGRFDAPVEIRLFEARPVDLAQVDLVDLNEARFDGVHAAHRALLIAAAALCISALFDLAIFLDFQWSKGANAALIVSNANLLALLFLGPTAIVAARARPLPVVASNIEQAELLAAKDSEVLDRIDHLLAEQRLSRDENLTLSRLARRAGVPARLISGAVNRLARKNVSQYINDFRIAEACRLLRGTDMPVTAAMLESGFQTKSNFNREFRRVTSLSPASWRERNRPSPP
ncbi:helix-turn-helix domain-containing protein [Sinorhizobium fredii]|uniref:helix-turn-helix domain-containing protein n=1 Tax=Rhizobium fredii TaxID=380 RepID=UPI0009B6C340|nr:AraC family transcriptional regulator [Sinorhizobium fredii]